MLAAALLVDGSVGGTKKLLGQFPGRCRWRRAARLQAIDRRVDGRTEPGEQPTFNLVTEPDGATSTEPAGVLEVLSMGGDGIPHCGDPLAVGGGGHEDRWPVAGVVLVAAHMAEVEHQFEVAASVVRPVAVGLVDYENVSDFKEARLVCLHRVAPTGVDDNDGRVGGSGDIDLNLADANRLDQDRVEPAGIEGSDRTRHRQGQTAGVPASGDGADEATEHRHLIKGGGGALTREKIVAQSAKQFVCIVDQTKIVKTLGAFPLPIEVIPMARGLVARALFSMGANPFWREGFVTDNGNQILDVHNLTISEPAALESDLNHLVGAVTNGLFARRPADVILCAELDGVKRI